MILEKFEESHRPLTARNAKLRISEFKNSRNSRRVTLVRVVFFFFCFD